MRKRSCLKAALLLVLLCGGGMITCVAVSVLSPPRTFAPSDLVGTWQVDYDQYDIPDGLSEGRVHGVETITLRANGAYQQVFSGVYTGPWNKWWLEDGWILHLQGARLFIMGIKAAEYFARGEAGAHVQGCSGKYIELDGTELILCAKPDPDAPGGIILEHLPVGDPDSPEIVEFHRIVAPVPTTTSVP